MTWRNNAGVGRRNMEPLTLFAVLFSTAMHTIRLSEGIKYAYPMLSIKWYCVGKEIPKLSVLSTKIVAAISLCQIALVP